MALTDCKIISSDLTNDISSLRDRPAENNLTADQLKERFDHIGKIEIPRRFNGLIDELAGSSGAADIGVTEISGLPTCGNVQNMLFALKHYLDGITLQAGVVTSVNTQTGTVMLNYADVGASPAGAAVTATYTATLSAASWAGSSAPYTQTVTVAGITATDKPIADVVRSGLVATAIAQLEAWQFVLNGKIVTGENQITATCYTDKPTLDIPIQMQVVR